jgi:hypothetical protein
MMRCIFTLSTWRVIAKKIGMAPIGFVLPVPNRRRGTLPWLILLDRKLRFGREAGQRMHKVVAHRFI